MGHSSKSKVFKDERDHQIGTHSKAGRWVYDRCHPGLTVLCLIKGSRLERQPCALFIGAAAQLLYKYRQYREKTLYPGRYCFGGYWIRFVCLVWRFRISIPAGKFSYFCFSSCTPGCRPANRPAHKNIAESKEKLSPRNHRGSEESFLWRIIRGYFPLPLLTRRFLYYFSPPGSRLRSSSS